MLDLPRIVITGVGLSSPNGNNLEEYRANLLAGVSGVKRHEVLHMGEVIAGTCDFDPMRYQKKKDLRRGTRVGSVSIWCANEALRNGDTNLSAYDPARVGVYIGITEHGTYENEHEVTELEKYDHDLKFWSHHHNPRTVANNPAGEVTLSMGLHGPAYTIGSACAAGNLGLIQAAQMLQLDKCDVAFGGGVSEATLGFTIFASFAAQGALGHHDDPAKASRPFDRDRNGIVVSDGGCLYLLERLEDAQARGARIYGELLGYAINSDGTDTVQPDAVGQNACVRTGLAHARVEPGEIDVVNTHATSTQAGDIVECQTLREIFGDCPTTWVNNTKSYIGHTMGAAGALELAGNLPSFTDGMIHPTINLDHLDPECEVRNLVANEPRDAGSVRTILNLSFGMLGINSAVVVRRWDG